MKKKEKKIIDKRATDKIHFKNKLPLHTSSQFTNTDHLNFHLGR